MSIRPIIAAVLALLSFATIPLMAACPSSVRRVVQQQIVRQQAVLAVPIVANAILVNAYGAGFQQQGYNEDLLRQLLEEIRALRLEMRNQKATTEPINAANLVGSGRGCVNCHQASTAKKGGEFVLVEDDGKLARLSLSNKAAIKAKVSQGLMPPPKIGIDLTDAEKAAVIELFTGVRP